MLHPADTFTIGLGLVQPESAWFTSGCSSVRARWLASGKIEIENEGAKERPLPPGVKKWRDLIVQKSNKHGLPPAFTAGVMGLESGGDPSVVSPAKAYGLMQLIASTATLMAGRPVSGSELLSNTDLNVDLGCKYLAELMQKYGNNPIKVTISYNAGSVKCGKSAKCSTPNRWYAVTDCTKSGASVDYPGIVFGYTNSAADWLGVPSVSTGGEGPGFGTVALVAAGLATWWWLA